jgi:Na+/H+-dicarboxylate symporter
MRVPLHAKILIGAAIGAVLGGAAHLLFADDPATADVNEAAGLAWTITKVSRPVGSVFINLLFMLVLPLIFCALSLAASEFRDLRRLGRVGMRTLAYTVVVSSIAVFIGITLVNLVRPGDGIAPDVKESLMERATQEATTAVAPPASGVDLLVNIVPRNPIKAAAEGDFLAWMFFSLMIGIGMCLVPESATKQLRGTLEGLFEVSMRLIGLVIALAPIGVAALLFTMTAEYGWDILAQLARYAGVVLAALLIHQVVVYSLAVRLLAGVKPSRFFRASQEAIVTAFSTSSSNATLPTALRVSDEKLRLPTHVGRFVLTIGATANQNGTALFEGVTVLFLAQFYGVTLDLGEQLIVVVMCILGGIGTAGVPSGSLPVIAMILGMIGVPVEGIGLIFGVDRFLDMCRTAVNVTGDLAAAVIVARGEGWTPDAMDSARPTA